MFVNTKKKLVTKFLMYKVCYLETSMDFFIFTNEQTHQHEEEKIIQHPLTFIGH